MSGDLGFSITGSLKTAGGFISDKAGTGYDAIKDAGSYVLDKTCSLVTDPRVQTVATVGAMYPSGYTQAGAGVVAAGTMACAAFGPSTGQSPVQTDTGYKMLSIPAGYTSVVAATYTAARTSAPRTPAIPTGSIAAYDPKRGGYRVAVPGPPRLSGLAGLAAAFTEVGVQANLPATARLVSLKTFVAETGAAPKPWYKKPLVLAGIGAGVLALGVGAVVLKRR